MTQIYIPIDESHVEQKIKSVLLNHVKLFLLFPDGIPHLTAEALTNSGMDPTTVAFSGWGRYPNLVVDCSAETDRAGETIIIEFDRESSTLMVDDIPWNPEINYCNHETVSILLVDFLSELFFLFVPIFFLVDLLALMKVNLS